MKVRVSRRQFGDLLAWTASQLDAKPTNPVFAGLLIEAAEDQITIAGTSYSGDARATLPADVMEPGRIVIPGRMAAQVVGAYNSELIELTDADQQLELTAGRDVFRMSVLAAHDFPQLSERRSVDGTVDSRELAAAVRQVAKATDNDAKTIGNELWRCAIQFVADGDRLLVWATDRYRMAARTIPWTPAGDQGSLEALVVGSSLEAAVKGLDGEIGLSFKGKTFGIGDQVRYSTIGLIDPGKRIPYAKFPTGGFTTETIVPVAELVDTIRRTVLVAGDGKPKILLGFGSDDITVRAAGDDTGATAMNHLDGQHLDGPAIQIACKPHWLQEALAVTDTPDVRIGLFGPTKPIVITAADPEASSYRHIVMPIRL